MVAPLTTIPDAPPSGAMDPRLRAAMVGVAAAGGAFAIVGAAAWSLRIGGSVLLGAALAVTNLWVLARIVRAVTAGARPGAGGKLWVLIALLKLLVLFAVVWGLITRDLVEPVALMAGFGALPIGVAIGSLVSDRAARSASGQPEAPPAEQEEDSRPDRPAL